jgi:hypothetical protein
MNRWLNMSELVSYINSENQKVTAQRKCLSSLSSRTALVPGPQSVSDGMGERRGLAHRVLRHIDITSISFLVLSYLLTLACTKTNTSGIYRRLAANGLP